MRKSCFPIILAIVFILFSSFSVRAQETNDAQALYEKGVQLGKERKFEEALKVLRQAQKLAPERADVHNAIGATFLGMGKFDDAVGNFRKALRLISAEGRDSADLRRNLCVAITLDKKAAEGLAECREALRLDPGQVANHLQLAATLRADGQLDEAIQVAENALQKFPDDERVLVFLGGAYAAKSDHARRLEILERLVQVKPKVSAYRVALSETYLAFDRVEEAAETAKKAIELDVLNPFAYYRLAEVYDELGMSEEVFATLQKAVELKPDAGVIYLMYGKNLAKLGNEAQAIINLREAARLMPDDHEAQYELGSQLAAASRFQEAVAPLRRANELKPNDLNSKAALGSALVEAGSYDEALRYLAEADRLRPGNSIIQMFIKVANARKQGFRDVEKIKQRVAENPKDFEAKKYLAQLYQFSGNLEEAERLFLESFKLQPETGESNNDLALFYFEARRYDLSVKYLRRAVELKKHHVLYLSLANSLSKLGRTQEVFDAYQKAFEIQPKSPVVLKLYADALRNAGKRREAIEMYQKLLQVEPRNAPALFNLAVLSLKLLDKENAIRYYETLRTVEPNLAKDLSWIFRLLK